MRYFFYGTLLDAEVRAWILGRRAASIPARLAAYRRVYLRGRVYPVAVPARAASVAGLLVDGLDRAAAARLRDFESDEYVEAVRPVTLATGAVPGARVFLAGRCARPTDRAWDIETWQRLHKAAFARRLRAPIALSRPC